MFRRGSVERFLQVFIEAEATELPQYKLQEALSAGAVYQALPILEEYGLVERVPCNDPVKGKVVCIRLTDKGRVVVEKLREIYSALIG